MKYWKDENRDGFNKEMETVRNILERKGYILESDHPYAYAMQYDLALEDIKDWLSKNGYQGNVGSIDNIGNFDKEAVYGLYDIDLISFEDMYSNLKDEAKIQNEESF